MSQRAPSLTSLGIALSLLFTLLMVVLLVIAIQGEVVKSPPDWLLSWTAWLVSALGVVFAPLVLANVTKALGAYVNRQLQARGQGSNPGAGNVR